MSVPIVVTTFRRSGYLENTVGSLKECGEDLSKLCFYSDGDKGEHKLARLFRLSRDYNVWISGKNQGVYQACVKAISLTFALYRGFDYVVYLQDDVRLSFLGLTKGVQVAKQAVYDGHNLAIMALYHRCTKVHDAPYNVMRAGHTGGVAWVVTRKFWADFEKNGIDNPCELEPNDKRKRHFVRNLCDYKIFRWAQAHDYRTAYVSRSLVQHVGDISSISEMDMSRFRTPNFVGVDG